MAGLAAAELPGRQGQGTGLGTGGGGHRGEWDRWAGSRGGAAEQHCPVLGNFLRDSAAHGHYTT